MRLIGRAGDGVLRSALERRGKKMGTGDGAAANRQASAAPFPAGQRPNPVRFALSTPVSEGMESNPFIHHVQKNRGNGHYKNQGLSTRFPFWCGGGD
jgi:hypothetical protein